MFCIDTGVTAEISIEQVCAKQNPILTQQSSQAIQCCLADVTSVSSPVLYNSKWSTNISVVEFNLAILPYYQLNSIPNFPSHGERV